MSTRSHSPEIPVVHILNGERYAGLERVVDSLAEEAPAHGYRLHLALLKPGVMVNRMASGNAIVHACTMSNRVDFRGVVRVSRVVRNVGATLIHSHTVRSALVARAVKWLTGARWVHHVHSHTLLESERPVLPRVNHSVERLILKSADRVIAVSHGLAEHVVAAYGLAPARVTTIHNGVPEQSDPLRSERAVPVIGCVGLFRPRKGLEVLIEAARLLRESHVPFLLRLVGDFESSAYEALILRRIAECALEHHVELSGFVQDVNGALGEIDVYVLPSLFGEGLPMTLLEAMARARTIVASRIMGVTEALTDECGCLVPSGDAGALAQAISALLADRDRARTLAKCAQQRQRHEFSSTRMCKAVFGTYN